MVRGIGNDIIEISRIRKSIEAHSEKFLDRLFHASEKNYCFKNVDSAPSFAGRFAAKEALVKALGIGFRNGIEWLDFEIINDENGRPLVIYSEKIREMFNSPNLLISISHCKNYASAFAVWVD